jgi:parallel beta-helix repeat protein
MISVIIAWSVLPAPPLRSQESAAAEAPAPPDAAFLIPASSTPAAPFVIKKPGCYRLAGDRWCRETGIEVAADHVTIDLMGFSLIGSNTGEFVGVVMENRRNVEIRNGTIRNFGARGIHEKGTGEKASGKRVIRIRAVHNGSCGICMGGAGNAVRDCHTAHNEGTGICSGFAGTVSGCTACYNGTGGLAAGEGSTVTGNTVSANKGTGIFAAAACTVVNNTCRGNDNSGIFAGASSLIKDNTVHENNRSNTPDTYAGIRVKTGCRVAGNTVADNRLNNIYVREKGNSVVGNLVTNTTGIPAAGIFFHEKENYFADNRVTGRLIPFAGQVPVGKGDGGGNVFFEFLPEKEETE